MSTTDPNAPPADDNQTQVQGDAEVVQRVTVHAGGYVENVIAKQVLQQPFTPRPVAATPEELAEAAAQLADLPTDAIPAPQDVLPPARG